MFDKQHKLGQRHLLYRANIPIPNTYCVTEVNPNSQFIARPTRHFGGQNYRLVEYSQVNYSHDHYYSEVFPKKWEYRVVFVKGVCALTLLKRAPDELDYTQPWNHANGAYFVTVNHNENNRLRHTNVYERLSLFHIATDASIVAFDILLSEDYQWVVTEANFCPALTIQSNLETISNIILRSFQRS